MTLWPVVDVLLAAVALAEPLVTPLVAWADFAARGAPPAARGALAPQRRPPAPFPFLPLSSTPEQCIFS